MRVRLLSRGSALAVLQADLVARALRSRWPDIDVELMTRPASGDLDPRASLWAATRKGVFTADLSEMLAGGQVECVVHSWKDLPIESHPETLVAATLERADPRDVLLVRRAVPGDRPTSLTVLSSSPRRAWELEQSLSPLLPWPVGQIRTMPVRGNIPTRLSRLVSGDGDALVVAKAALDRLLSAEANAGAAADVREMLGRCRWMVLPLQLFPTAAAQGAIAIEVAAGRQDVVDRVRAINHAPSWEAVSAERAILASFGGGCHDAIGITVLRREYGEVRSVRAQRPDGPHLSWALAASTPPPPRTDLSCVWPRPDERKAVRRYALETASMPPSGNGLWVARAEAWPLRWTTAGAGPVWAAGTRTWERLASRGVWVNGCADGLGDAEAPAIDALAGHAIEWVRVTHNGTGDPKALATYEVERDLPSDLGARSHFFWTSGSLFRRALEASPGIGRGWHASGPGRTARVIHDTLGSAARTSVWLDYDQWLHAVTS
jgi:hydroxymethylbilane synthase